MIHYIPGKEEDFRLRSKTACGHTAEDLRQGSFVFWRDRAKVDCVYCKARIEKTEKFLASVR